MTASPDTAVTVIDADAQFADAFAALQSQLFAQAWDSESFTALMQQPASLALIALSGDEARPVGFVLGRVIADEAEIMSIGVAQDRQRQGIAARLMTDFVRLAGKHGADRVFLEVAEDNEPARQLYLAQGFSEVGRRGAYYERPQGTRVDALVLARNVQR